MEDINKKPLAIIAFFAFLIALFFAAEQLDYYPNCHLNRMERKTKAAKKMAASWPKDMCHKMLCPVHKGMKCAKNHASHWIHEFSDRLMF